MLIVIFVYSQYFVAIAPNVDITLVAAICVAMDEREEQNK